MGSRVPASERTRQKLDELLTQPDLIVYSLVFAVALAVLADMIGLATIIGAFAAGLVLGTTERRGAWAGNAGTCLR